MKLSADFAGASVWAAVMLSLALRYPSHGLLWITVLTVAPLLFGWVRAFGRGWATTTPAILIGVATLALVPWYRPGSLVATVSLGMPMLLFTPLLGAVRTGAGYREFLVSGTLLLLAVSLVDYYFGASQMGARTGRGHWMFLVVLTGMMTAAVSGGDGRRLADVAGWSAVGLALTLLLGGAVTGFQVWSSKSPGVMDRTTSSDAVVFKALFPSGPPAQVYWVDHRLDVQVDAYRWMTWGEFARQARKNGVMEPPAGTLLGAAKEASEMRMIPSPRRTRAYFIMPTASGAGKDVRLWGTVPSSRRIVYGAQERGFLGEVIDAPDYVADRLPSTGLARSTLLSSLPAEKEWRGRRAEDLLSIFNRTAELAPRTASLSDALRAESSSDREYTLKTLKWFARNLKYNFDFQSASRDDNLPDAVLFGTRKGVCRHFASAFATMMRQQGVPARVVIGWRGFGPMSRGGVVPVRDREAHAWTEVLLDGRWELIDPTAVVPVEKGIPESSSSGLSGMFRFLSPSSSREEMSVAGGLSAERPSRRLPEINGVLLAVALLSAFLGVVLWRWPRHPEREWRSLLHHASLRGWQVSASDGPRWAFGKMAPHLKDAESMRSVTGAMEQWAYAGAVADDGDLAMKIRFRTWAVIFRRA